MFYESNKGGKTRARKIATVLQFTHRSCGIRWKWQYPMMHSLTTVESRSRCAYSPKANSTKQM